MAIVETRATASHRYYMNKKKDDIIDRVCQLHKLVHGRHLSFDDVTHLKTMTKDALASRAMELHRELPDG